MFKKKIRRRDLLKTKKRHVEETNSDMNKVPRDL